LPANENQSSNGNCGSRLSLLVRQRPKLTPLAIIAGDLPLVNPTHGLCGIPTHRALAHFSGFAAFGDTGVRSWSRSRVEITVIASLKRFAPRACARGIAVFHSSGADRRCDRP
jgi:hypothetical protein